ncbi:MAG: hypothetical protein ACRDOI_44230 [Trebonia sp.]
MLTWSAGAVANALDKLVSFGTAQMVTDEPRTYRLAPASDAAGEPGTSAETNLGGYAVLGSVFFFVWALAERKGRQPGSSREDDRTGPLSATWTRESP